MSLKKVSHFIYVLEDVHMNYLQYSLSRSVESVMIPCLLFLIFVIFIFSLPLFCLSTGLSVLLIFHSTDLFLPLVSLIFAIICNMYFLLLNLCLACFFLLSFLNNHFSTINFPTNITLAAFSTLYF